jgi:hypothetical protein
VVGTAIARNAWPSRISRDGTVHVNTSDSVWAFELAHRGPEIASRLGVGAVRFAPGPLAEAEAGKPPEAGPVPSRDELRRAAEIAAPIEDENLRKSVEKAVSLSLAQARSDRPV